MNTRPSPYSGHRYPPEIISHAVWLYHRFCLSLRDVEDLLAEPGSTVSYESIRQWCAKFGPEYARALKRRQGTLGDTWYLDEVFVTIAGQRQYLWRAVDQDGDTLDILLQSGRDRGAAERFFRKLLKGQAATSRCLVTDKLKSYSAARRTTIPSVPHVTEQYANNRAEVSHEPTRQRERQSEIGKIRPRSTVACKYWVGRNPTGRSRRRRAWNEADAAGRSSPTPAQEKV
jgi:putative transposase